MPLPACGFIYHEIEINTEGNLDHDNEMQQWLKQKEDLTKTEEKPVINDQPQSPSDNKKDGLNDKNYDNEMLKYNDKKKKHDDWIER